MPPEKAPQQPLSYDEDPNWFSPLPPLVDFGDAGPPNNSTVTTTQCIAHLKLLSVFADLRAAISTDDGLFGIYDSQAHQFVDEQSRNMALARIREKRWAVYTTRAAERYADWWHTCVLTSERAPCMQDIAETSSYKLITQPPTPVEWSSKSLPPLDVLMVWHAHMLNPRAYLEDCIRGGKMMFWSTGMPWELVNQAIDDKTLNYNPGHDAKEQFRKRTRHPWENLDEPPERAFSCLQCNAEVTAPWTRGEMGPKVESAFESCTGYADKSFEAWCSRCNGKLDHQALRAARFHKDAKAVQSKSYPMPGTYLGLEGLPKNALDLSLPNRMIQAAPTEIVGATDPRGPNRDMNRVRSLVETAMRNTHVMMVANGRGYVRLQKKQRIAIRRMMSHYWDNSSIFGLNLVGAVIRQGTFIQKMDDLDWIHSSTLQSTMTRLIKKYGVFFYIMAKNPDKMAVPTLDVDLAWHTHQLSPSRYFEYSVYQTKTYGVETFIDHDDKVDEGKLSEAFKWTSKQYQSATHGEVYSECTCWYCEATREMSHSVLSSSSRRARNMAQRLHDDPNVSSNPNNSPHISAHNAVRVSDAPSSYQRSTALHEMRLRNLRAKWERREQNRRNRSNSANNNDGDRNNYNANDPYIYAYPMVWGYPYAIPFYAPYMCNPGINADAYPCNPACMSVGATAYGSCAAGSCGGAVAAGSCGGGGGCAGGHAGGCGGGAGGGCGGGGGGGCGGGGGGGGGGGCGGGGGG
ncbi:Reticuline oxidase [Talaromyces islandicus]|uniref:Reticuline oxidase n=1 Tax=Talaromyces islandicus TaxID=28573 RepID=A0A0U1LXV7_TALIS|nr:Reticuline oxidase [Talaromyces islandicus]